MNWRDAIEQVLRGFGRTAHVREITAEIQRQELLQTFAASPEANVSSAISKAMRDEGDDCPFIQVQSGVYLWWDASKGNRPGTNLDEVVLGVMRDADETLHFSEVTDRTVERLGLPSDQASAMRKSVNSLLSREDKYQRVGVGEYRLASSASPVGTSVAIAKPAGSSANGSPLAEVRVTSQESNETEEVEGLGDEDSGWGEYPIDTVLIRNEPRTVFDVTRRISQKQYVMDPDFQRDFIWPDDKQSKLIESVLMRIPLPVFYLAEDHQGRMIAVDGLQRLSTFERFLNNDLKLKLPSQVELHGKRFQDLSPKLQNRVEDCILVLYIVDAKVPERARLDIFERVNGGVPLTRQQMRNCLYMGVATRFLKDEAASDLFKEATGQSLRSSTMRDREFVNRFCAFRLLDLDTYNNKEEMDGFLAQALTHMNAQPGPDLSELSAEFQTGLRNNLAVFGEHAFRKHQPDQERRGVLNASLWDVMSTGLSRIPEGQVYARREELLARFYALMEDGAFIRSITYGPNSVKAVRHRFEVVNRMLAEVFGAQDD